MLGDLPAELVAFILESLEKRDLKALRLSYKAWRPLIMPLLFNRAFIAPREKDLEVLRLMSAHEEIRLCVKELVLDTSYFKNMYDETSLAHHLVDEGIRLVSMGKLTDPEHPFVKHWEEFMSVPPNFRPGKGILMEPGSYNGEFRTSQRRWLRWLPYSKKMGIEELTSASWAKWEAMARYQLDALESAAFYDFVGRTISWFENADKVTLDNSIWQKQLSERYDHTYDGSGHNYPSGSPLARSWDPLMFRPVQCTADEGWRHQLLVGFGRVLRQAQLRIKRIDCSSDNYNLLPLECTFNILNYGSEQESGSLEELTLSIYTFEPHGPAAFERGMYPQCETGFRGLACFQPPGCQSMRQLSLDFPTTKRLFTTDSPITTDELWNFHAIFDPRHVWPKLTDLCIRGVQVHAQHLIDFLRNNCPKLRHLELGEIHLRSGSWSYVISMLHELKLKSFQLDRPRYFPIYWKDGTTGNVPKQLLSDETKLDILDAIQDYVVTGNERRCLWTNAPMWTCCDKFRSPLLPAWCRAGVT